jgi:LmbE family N-acetylglucosaminyl deacetylase
MAKSEKKKTKVMIHMNSSLVTATTATDSNPSHNEIAQCARELWTESGQPEGRDEAIWFEAERRLIAERQAPVKSAVVPQTTAPKTSPTQKHDQKSRRSSRNQKYVM